MFDFLSLLSPSNFMPHGHCFFWKPLILWTHVVADILTAVSYYSIPIALVVLVRRRADLAYNWMALLFAAFIFLCGTTHLFNIWTIWVPSYWTEGIVKLATGLVSVACAIALWPLIPKILALPSAEELQL